MQEHSVLEVPASPANGTNDLLSRLYREIGISAVAAALEINHPHADHAHRQLAEARLVPLQAPAAR